MQLVAYGAPDNFLIGCGGEPSNMASVCLKGHWQIRRASGRPTKHDLRELHNATGDRGCSQQQSIFHEFPTHHHLIKSVTSDNVVQEKMARRIQSRWKMCISNASYRICRRRLLRELQDDTEPPTKYSDGDNNEFEKYRQQEWADQSWSMFAHFPKNMRPNMFVANTQRVQSLPIVRTMDSSVRYRDFRDDIDKMTKKSTKSAACL